MVHKSICWYLGHKPGNYKTYGDGPYDNTYTPCSRCGILDIGYHDLVMPSRHKRLKEELKFWFYFRWIVIRFKNTNDPINDEEIPF